MFVSNLSIWYFVSQDRKLNLYVHTLLETLPQLADLDWVRQLWNLGMEGFWTCPVALRKNRKINIRYTYELYIRTSIHEIDSKNMWQICIYLWPINHKFNCDLKTHHRRPLSCWPSTWGDSCILTTLRVLTRRGDSTFSGRLAAACQEWTIYNSTIFHGIPENEKWWNMQFSKTRRTEGLAFLNCFLGLKHGPHEAMAQSNKAIDTETWQRLRNDIRLYCLSSAKINREISRNVTSARIQRPAHVWAPSLPTNRTDHSATQDRAMPQNLWQRDSTHPL